MRWSRTVSQGHNGEARHESDPYAPKLEISAYLQLQLAVSYLPSTVASLEVMASLGRVAVEPEASTAHDYGFPQGTGLISVGMIYS